MDYSENTTDRHIEILKKLTCTEGKKRKQRRRKEAAELQEKQLCLLLRWMVKRDRNFHLGYKETKVILDRSYSIYCLNTGVRLNRY